MTVRPVNSIYADRLVVTGQLAEVLSLIQQNQNAVARSVLADPALLPKEAAEIAERIEKITATWNAYSATKLATEEKDLAAQFIAHRGRFVDGGLKPALAAMRAGDLEALKKLALGPVAELYPPVRDTLRQLVKLQLTVGKQEFEASQHRYQSSRAIAIGLILFGVLSGGTIGFWLIRGITRSLDQALTIARSVAEGDLTSKSVDSSNDEIGMLLKELERMRASLVSVVVQVRSGTEAIATGSSQIASGNQDLSARTEQQASSLEETASSMEELTATVKQNADNARQANQLAMSASAVAVRGGSVVSQVVETMGSINDSAKKIVDIIGVIDGIAFQTNILALNAAVEAARAGEQGRGFAVVASEVRSLAQRSAAAAKEIKGLIGDSVEKVDMGSRLVGDAGTTMDEIVESVKRVNDIMAEIMAASAEQSAGIEQINQVISQMDQVTQQNAALVEEASAAAESLQEQGAGLARTVTIFKLDASASGLQPKRVANTRPQDARASGLFHDQAG